MKVLLRSICLACRSAFVGWVRLRVGDSKRWSVTSQLEPIQVLSAVLPGRDPATRVWTTGKTEGRAAIGLVSESRRVEAHADSQPTPRPPQERRQSD